MQKEKKTQIVSALLPLVDLHLIFEIFLTGFLPATQAVKIKSEIDKKSSSKINFVN